MFKSKKSTKIRTTRTGRRLCFALAIGLGFLSLISCNVTRKVTTQSEYLQRGDTSITIVTRTIESYDASKKIQ